MGKNKIPQGFTFDRIYQLFGFLHEKKLELDIIKHMLPVLYKHPAMDFQAVLNEIGFKRYRKKQILSHIPACRKDFRKIRTSQNPFSECKWMMKRMLVYALGNMPLAHLSEHINKEVADAG
jgi:hypothetical protein